MKFNVLRVMELTPVEERMCQGFGGREPLLVVDFEASFNHVLRLITDKFELRVVEVILAVNNFIEHFIATAALKRQISAHEYVKDDAERPDVTFRIIMAVQHFWSHVVRRSRDGFTLFRAVHPLAEPEVDQFELAICRQHDVVGLDVSVDDALRVQVVQRRE